MTYPWNAGELLRAVDLDAAFAARLPLAGGTLTGDLLSANPGRWNVPVGTTAQRPNTGNIGDMRYNSTTGRFEFGVGGSWKNYVNLDGDTGIGSLTMASGATITTSGAGGFTSNSGTGIVSINNGKVTSPFMNVGNGATLSLVTAGITTQPHLLSYNVNGATTAAGNTWGGLLRVNVSSDTATTVNGSLDYVLITANTGTGFQGFRNGLWSQVKINAATTLSASSDGITSVGGRAIGGASGGGISGAPLGTVFGGNFWATLTSGATNYAGCVGTEIDASMQTGSSAGYFAVMQLILTSDHAVQGTNADTGVILAAQQNTGTGLRNAYVIGNYGGQWPVDPNGYLFQTQIGINRATNPSTGAGGFDLNQFVASGSGPEGGGFYWRSPGVKVRDTELVVGYGSISADSNGAVIDANYKKMNTAAGSITVTAGGSGWTTGDEATDAYGNTVVVTAAAGAVTGISSVLTRGWQSSAPANPVTFTARTKHTATYGTGLTLNLGSWTTAAALSIQPTPGGKLGFNGATPIVKPTGVAVTAAGIHAALVSLGLIAP